MTIGSYLGSGERLRILVANSGIVRARDDSCNNAPPAVDLRVGELFPGGRWKHRTSSSSTTSTLMVEIAATAKQSMAVPERRCMRRWSSGLRVVKWAKKRCTTKPPIHAQWKEGEVSKKARPSVLGGRTRSSTRTRPPWIR